MPDFKCTHAECGRVFRSKTGFQAHQNGHNGIFFHCEALGCDKKYDHDLKLKKHIKDTHINERQVFLCEEPGCESKFITKIGLKGHANCHIDRPLFPCTVIGCSTVLTNASNLRRHVVNHGRGDDTWSCVECGENFVDRDKLRIHFRSHNFELIPCEQCEKTFLKLRDLERHRLSHGKERRMYPCVEEACGKVYTTQFALEIHYNHHKGIKPFMCQYENCTKVFVSKKHVDEHELSHTNIRPFKCKYPKCGRAFRHPNKLRDHEKCRHIRELNYICQAGPDGEPCGAGFYTKTAYKQHLRGLHHGIETKFTRRSELWAKTLLQQHDFVFTHGDWAVMDAMNGDTKSQRLIFDFVVYTDRCIFILEIDEHQHGFGGLREDDMYNSMKRRRFDHDDPKKQDTTEAKVDSKAEKLPETTTHSDQRDSDPDDSDNEQLTEEEQEDEDAESDESEQEDEESEQEQDRDCLGIYEITCEQRRLESAIAWVVARQFDDGTDLPVSVIRFNPDDFKVDGIAQHVDIEDRGNKLVDYLKNAKISGGEIQFMFYTSHTIGSEMIADVVRHKDYHPLASSRCLPAIVQGHAAPPTPARAKLFFQIL